MSSTHPDTQASTQARERTAVVIGASIAGVLAARSLTRHYDRVTLVDRDELPHGPAARGGVPQGRHTHGLLVRGLQVIESLFPGVTDELVAEGAVLGDMLADGRWNFPAGRLASGRSGLRMLGVSRPLLEHHLRRRLLADSRIRVAEGTSVLDLAFAADGARVVGVRVAGCSGGRAELLAADLVVDASGRNARTPEWLQRRGYDAPEEEVVRCDKHYATRQFRVRKPDRMVVRAVNATATKPRSGVMVRNEDDRWTVSLTSTAGDRPPRELDGFVRFARSLASPDVAAALRGLEPLDDGLFYRFPASRRRRYERLAEFPEGLVVTGDALCSFDPVYGQGMTVAALEAEELGRCLDAGRHDLARRFHKRAAVHIDTPWMIAVGAGPRPMAAYIDRLLAAAVHDPELAAAFLRVSHLVDPPQQLLRLPVVLRVAKVSVGLGRGRHDLEKRLAQRVQKGLPVDAA
ncbi:FAD-dependent oxidoreductase [Nocardioides speluncae]|uniref:FAD-dependent oxidoreductase n=1 Tax=Nocardioides speluncae TaxID=2670337 RepID=UPI000D698F3E|nr:FAD-dependent oxidoreductase [Nocardioides speluncae]